MHSPRVQLREEELATKLRAHVGHQVRCVSTAVAPSDPKARAAGQGVETISIRCDSCDEVIIEAVKRGPR